jgi:hypothetical protein
MLAKVARSEKTEGRRDLSILEVGSLVLIQDTESRLWNSTGRIVSIHDKNERSYWIKRIGSRKLIRRNRIHLRPLNETKKISKRSIEFNPELKKLSDLKGQSRELDTMQPKQQQAHKPLTTEPPMLRRSERIKMKAAKTNACRVQSCASSCPYSKKKNVVERGLLIYKRRYTSKLCLTSSLSNHLITSSIMCPPKVCKPFFSYHL